MSIYFCYFHRGSGCEVLWWVRLCDCLSVREDISGTTRAILYQIFVNVAYGRGSVLLRQGDEIPRGRGSFGFFFPYWQCVVQHSIWDPYENGWTDRDAVWDDEWAWLEEQCGTWGWRSPKVKGQFWGKYVPDKPNTPMNCELDWSMQRRAHDRDRRLTFKILPFAGMHCVARVRQRQLSYLF